MGNKNLSDHDSPTISSNNLSIPNQSSRAVYADLPKQKIVNQTLQDGRMNEPPLKNQIQKLSIGMDAVQKQIHDIKAKIYAIEKTVHKKEQSKNELLTYRELTKKRLSTLKSLESSYGSELKVVLDQLKVLLNQKQLFERNINRVQEESKSAESSLHSSNLKIALVDSAILKLNSSLTENQSKIDKLKSLLNTNRAIIVEKRRATQDQLKKSLDTVS
ncbi:hypothetical protein BC833DRAFT_52583 [Globomyces pollinis-pini]|nr:hypothetical protein BC833DRAFT_52583 [Globomyces pollinis-pini]